MSYTPELRNIIAQIRRVVTGDLILPEDHNLQSDGLEKSADYIDDIYARIINLIQRGGIFSADLIPNVDLSLNIGSDTKRWNNLFANKGQFSYSLTTPIISVSDETFTNKLAVGRITTDLFPKEELSLNIGSSDLKWNEVHARKGFFDELYLAGSPIVPGKYKCIATGSYNESYSDGMDVIFGSSLSGGYKIGVDTFPVINQVLQPYDLLTISVEFFYHIVLGIPSGVSDFARHSFSSLAEFTDYPVTKTYSVSNFREAKNHYITNQISGCAFDRGHGGVIFIIIPPDLDKLQYYATIHSWFSYLPEGVSILNHELEIATVIALYRLT
jgi:hypothetical protein